MTHPLRKRLAITAAATISLTASLTTANADYATPKGAFRTYTKALAAGDGTTAKESVIASAKHNQLLDSQIAYAPIEAKFKAACIKSYPASARELGDTTADTLKAIDDAEVKITGDSATLITRLSIEPVTLKRVEGKWKVDLVTMYGTDDVDEVLLFRKALGEVMTDMLPDIEAAKYKDFNEVKNTLEMRVKMRTALPRSDEEDNATTRPDK